MDYSEPLDLSLPSVKMKNTYQNSETDMPLDLSKKRTDNPHIIQTGPFTSTNIHNITNFSSDKRSGMHQSCGSSSLPYLNSTKPRNAHSCVQVQDKFSDNYEELQSSEEPFNFSFRYSEPKTINGGQKVDHSNSTFKGKKSKNSNENFTIYAETDLDQPTDYSLRYAENDSDSESEVCDNPEKTTTAEFVGDTVKTYCTEGTPYETPFNFSTSTSMSDLRISEKNTVDSIEIQEEKTTIKENIPEDNLNDKSSKEKTVETESPQPQTPKLKSEFNSGLTSPEKPMNYCEEGTPGYFSRVSSFGSLNSAAGGSGEEKLSEEKHKCEDQNIAQKADKMQQKMPSSEVKVVKFENMVNYCEETPLMFSRSSSLGSLGSMEQHSMHDDRSSVISDFSRLTSGIISPSEIPDSPTQTVPPSPKQQKSSEFSIINRNSSIENRRHASARRSLPIKSSIFEDDITKFKEESTPAQFSVATSLSSLTIDDNDETQMQDEPERNCGKGSSSEQDVDTNIGNPNSQDETDCFRNTRDNIQNRCYSLPENGQFASNFQDSTSMVYNQNTSRMMPPPLSDENTTHLYNTEDTPAILSHNGSISDLSLSTLSMLDEEPGVNMVYLSENSSQSSEENRNILANKNQIQASGSRQEIEDVWVRREQVRHPDSTPYQGVKDLPPFLASRDEYSQFAVEDSPAQFSLRSSLSHLTIESEMASGIQEFLPNDATETPHDTVDSSPGNTSEQINQNSDDVETQEEPSIGEPSTVAISEPGIDDDISNGDIQTDVCDSYIKDNVDTSNENSKSYELKHDDSRYNSMKKRKWKWKWQFGTEETHQSESGESTPTDRRSCSNNEEFDQERRNRVDKTNAGSLDASFRKKKWWKWKFGSKEKDSTGTPHNTVPETIQNCLVDNDQNQKSNSVDQKESESKDGTTVDARNKSKRWKWKWKLNFKDDESSKPEKCSIDFSKLKHQVSPEDTREPICINELSQSSDIPKEMSSTIKLSSQHHSQPESGLDGNSGEIPHLILSSDEPLKNMLQEQVTVHARRKLDTPEPSDSEQSVIIEEINEANIYEDTRAPCNRKLSDHFYNNSFVDLENIEENNSDCAALVEECIQLGMPQKKNISDKVASHDDTTGLRTCNKMSDADYRSTEYRKEQCHVLSRNTAVDRMAILEECIQLGMQKKSKENILNKHIEDNINSPKTNYKSLNQKGSTSLFLTNKSFDVLSMKELKTQGTRNPMQEYSSEKLTRAKSTNFDSSSLSRLSLGRPQRNNFISNENILSDIPNEAPETLAHSNAKRPYCNEFYDGRSFTTNSSKISEHDSYFNSESSSRTAPRALDSKSFSSKCFTSSQIPSENHSHVVSKNVGKVSLQNEIMSKSGCSPNSGKNPDFAALIEECIQLGMPKRKESSGEASSTTSSPSLVNKKLSSVKRWPEYLSRVAGENKSASLPKKSSAYLSTPQNYCASNEDFTSADSQLMKNSVIQNAFVNNISRPTNNGFKSDMLKKKQDKIIHIPSETRFDLRTTMKEFNVPRRNEEPEESLYANADETRSYSNPTGRQLSCSYKSPSSVRSPTFHYELTSKKGISSDEEDNATLIKDCVRLGVPVKKLHELRRSLNRKNLQEPVKSKDVEEFVRSTTPRTVDSEDGAVYANTTERYSTFQNPLRPECGAMRNGEKTLSPNPYNSDDANSSILAEKKTASYLATSKNFDSKNTIVNDRSIKKSTNSESLPASKNNQDFAAIIEECIQLGMPKRKERSREILNSNLSLSSINSRSNSVTRYTEDLPKASFEFNRSATLPKGSTYSSSSKTGYSSNEDCERSNFLKKQDLIAHNTPPGIRKNLTQNQQQLGLYKKDVVGATQATPKLSSTSLPQKNSTSPASLNIQQVDRVPKINTDMSVGITLEDPQQEVELEESLYVNVSKHVGYSRSTRRQNLPEEFISPPGKVIKPQNHSVLHKKDVNTIDPNYSALVEECIKLGMPPKKMCEDQKYEKNISPQNPPNHTLAEESELPNGMDLEETAIYANTSERYSTFKSPIPESGLNRSSRTMSSSNIKSSASCIKVGELDNRKTNSTTSNTIEKALEECIQLGWPKKKETDKSPPSKYSNVPLNDTSIKKVEIPTSKNVNVASVARNMQNLLACSKMPTTVTGARDDSEVQSVSIIESDKEETITVGLEERNGFNTTSNYSTWSNELCTDDNQQTESEMSFAGLADIDAKLLDPQLVLESLEKYTAKLISEAELRLNSKNYELPY